MANGGAVSFPVRTVNSKDLFIGLPRALVDLLFADADSVDQVPSLLAVKATRYSGDEVYFAWSGSCSGDHHLNVPRHLAQANGLRDGEVVTLMPAQVPVAAQVHMAIGGQDDWEITELQPGYMEELLLTQVRFVQKGQVIPIYVREQALVHFRVVACQPDHVCVQLDPDTEVIVAPPEPARTSGQASTSELGARDGSTSGHGADGMRPRAAPDQARTAGSTELGDSTVCEQPAFRGVIKVHCHDEAGTEDTSDMLVHSAYISPPLAHRMGWAADTLIQIQVVDTAGDALCCIEGESSARNAVILARVNVPDKGGDNSSSSSGGGGGGSSSSSSLGLDSISMQQLRISPGSRVRILPYQSSPSQSVGGDEDTGLVCTLSPITWHQSQGDVSTHRYVYCHACADFITARFRHLCQDRPWVRQLLQQQLVRLRVPSCQQARGTREVVCTAANEASDESDLTAVTFQVSCRLAKTTPKTETQTQSTPSRAPESHGPSEGEGPGQAAESLGRVIALSHYRLESVRVGEVQHKVSIVPKPPTLPLASLHGISDATRAIDDALWSCLHSASRAHTLITGSRGYGRTSLLQALQWHAIQEFGMHTQLVSCRDLADLGPAKILAAIRSTIRTAQVHAPSVVFLDDLDAIVPHREDGGAGGGAPGAANATELIATCLAKSTRHQISAPLMNSQVCFISTAETVESLSQTIVQSPLTAQHCSIPPLTPVLRTQILVTLLECKYQVKLSDVDSWQEVEEGTDGCTAADLDALAWRVVHRCAERHAEGLGNGRNHSTEGMVPVSLQDMREVLQDFVPSSRSTLCSSTPDVKWEDIGGLEETKTILLEALAWPTRYERLYRQAGLEAKSGVLLYGPPGCGKTMLASAVAAQCGLSFISVKGPELLDKYIGASEQAVRDTFSKAAAVAPAVIFFDEFEAIAPRRGHDNSGVSDRVVNQFLTALDGVEGRNGIHVLAATSRPDLIDPALLRPGRLDRSLLCDLPDTAERLAILRSFTSRVHLSTDVMLEDVAARTLHYSGADLQGLVYNAQLMAIHERLKEQEGGRVASSHSNSKGKGRQVPAPDPVTSDDDDCSWNGFSLVLPLSQESIKKSEQVSLGLLAKNIVNQRTPGAQGPSPPTTTITNDGDAAPDVIVTGAHFAQALVDSKPSLSAAERQRFRDIYYRFTTGDVAGDDRPKKATLA